MAEYEWMIWLSALSLLLFVATLVALPWVIVRLPANFFTRQLDQPPNLEKRRQNRQWLMPMLRNICGALLLVAGFFMLFLPGQGLLTLLMGLCLLDFPGKPRLMRKLVHKINRPTLLKKLNKLRARYHRPPFEQPHNLQR